MIVFVTGGAGYIGSHTCKALAEAGHEPVVLDNLLYGHEYAVQWGPLEKIDLQSDLKPLFERYRPDAVIHFAARTYVGESVIDPLAFYKTNVGSTVNLLQTIVQTKIVPFVFSSTCAVYGDPHYTPLDEKHPKSPVSPYGRSKLMVEEILEDSARAYGLPFAALRYFNAAGAAGDIGEDHTPETHLIPLAIEAAMKEDAIKIFGTDYDTPDGTAIRDYIHVEDLARAHVLALSRCEKPLKVNLGTGQGHSVREILSFVEKITGKKLTIQEKERRPGDPSRLVANPRAAEKLLGWRSTYTIHDIIESAYKWHRRQFS